jgi:hypothetical protein
MTLFSRIAVGLFFIAYLFLGLAVFRDYGFSCDEAIERELGWRTYLYLSEGNFSLFSAQNVYYGPLFQTALYGLERLIGLHDTRDIYFMRHLATFLLFYAAVFTFYRLCARHFGSWKIGLLGAFFLVLSPRIFAHSFYNPKDLPFLSLFIIAVYTMLVALERRSLSRMIVAGVVSAALISVRVGGILVPVIMLLFLAGGPMRMKEGVRPVAPALLVYTVSVVFFTWIFWPALREDPLTRFMEALKFFSDYPLHPYRSLFQGEFTKPLSPPSHYLPLWIAITIPLSYLALFIVGVMRVFWQAWREKRQDVRRDHCAFLIWFFAPLLTVIVLGSNVYDDWRQLYFIYPALLFFSLNGLLFLMDGVSRFPAVGQRTAQAAIIVALLWDMVSVVQFMVKNHPFQNVYFNNLIGGIQGARYKFELDYYGLSHRKALEMILASDRDGVIKIFMDAGVCGTGAVALLPEDLRRRVKLVTNFQRGGAKYFFGNYRLRKIDYPYKNEVYAVKVDGVSILSVYLLP